MLKRRRELDAEVINAINELRSIHKVIEFSNGLQIEGEENILDQLRENMPEDFTEYLEIRTSSGRVEDIRPVAICSEGIIYANEEDEIEACGLNDLASIDDRIYILGMMEDSINKKNK